MERERRVTAGKRMTALVGKALEDDDAFWGHDTWNEDNDDDDNASFRSSDEDSALKRDEFDSDFDDSENEDDENAQDEERGRREEEMLHLEERKAQRGKAVGSASSSSYRDVASKASRSQALRKQKGRQSVTGRGLNAGIVLNVPGIVASAAPVAAGTSLNATTAVPSALQPVAPTKAALPTTTLSIARTKPRRAITKPKRKAAETAARQMASAASSALPPSSSITSLSAGTAPTGPSSPTAHKTKKRKSSDPATTSGGGEVFTQEQMILEAVHETEPDNERWRLARERRMRDSDQQLQQQQQSASREHHKSATIVEKFVSRRGYLNVVSFPEMDHVPPILQQQHNDGQRHSRGHNPSSSRAKPVCIITGKPAKYRDPKTGHAYHDVGAFREIRRRYEAGEPIVPSTAPRPPDGNGDTPKVVVSDPNGTKSTADDSVQPSAGNAANAVGDQEPTEAAKRSSSTSSPLRIHIRAPLAIASLHPSTATTASSESKAFPSETSPEASAPSGPVQVPTAAKNATSEVPTNPIAQPMDSTAISEAVVATLIAPAKSQVEALVTTAAATANGAEVSPATDSVPTNCVPGPVAPQQISSSPLPKPSRKASVGEVPSTPPRAESSNTLSSSSTAPPLHAAGYALHSHPAPAPSLPPLGPGLVVRASPRQRKPTAKVLHSSP